MCVCHSPTFVAAFRFFFPITTATQICADCVSLTHARTSFLTTSFSILWLTYFPPTPAWAKRRIAVVAASRPPRVPCISFCCSFPLTIPALSRVRLSASVSFHRSALPPQLRSKWEQGTRGRLSARVPAAVSIRLPFSTSSALLPFAHPLPSVHHGIHFRTGLARGSGVGLPR